MFKLIPQLREIRYPNMTYPLEIGVITNGYLYNPEFTELFNQYSVDIVVSIDRKKNTMI
ncbi:hypothetical protein [Anoxybacter fermentans]|uniref:hypothetical protein n=1 Tax=Anoxybacter fermentans TaxID=1323375 RepID=UPI0013DE85F7|nr:hypothetical protein [Anoxybacter fermentans]